ncbi:phage head-tail joining protein [Methylobacterium pseudosasicola]|uniref:GpW protein n=1 Tax=Methylobacterium pseudosasicola TaxID=582667 RepID=A0A1I4THQ9_9HYPH|nr:hypothetical protein [Methylobacterium pseudosasicola]SFM76195.1 hypothetical protein SAMN05192568_10543 [Methylobacterium pseudosasicola]
MIDQRIAFLANLRNQLAALDGAMASGVLTLEDNDTGRITYRSYAEMRQARADLLVRMRDLELELSPVVPRRTRQVVMTGRSGW